MTSLSFVIVIVFLGQGEFHLWPRVLFSDLTQHTSNCCKIVDEHRHVRIGRRQTCKWATEISIVLTAAAHIGSNCSRMREATAATRGALPRPLPGLASSLPGLVCRSCCPVSLDPYCNECRIRLQQAPSYSLRLSGCLSELLFHSQAGICSFGRGVKTSTSLILCFHPQNCTFLMQDGHPMALHSCMEATGTYLRRWGTVEVVPRTIRENGDLPCLILWVANQRQIHGGG